LLRWEYQPGIWEWRPDLPPPAFEDHPKRLWFADESGTVLEEHGTARPIPDLFPPLLEDPSGAIWGAGKTGVVRSAEGQLATVSSDVSDIVTLKGGIVDASSAIWLYGENHSKGHLLAGLHAGSSMVFGPEAFGGRHVSSVAADPRQGIWEVLYDEGASSHDLVEVTDAGVVDAPIDGINPHTHGPSLCASRTWLYLYGYNGLWEVPCGERLKFVQAQAEAGTVFTRAVSDGEVAAVVTQEGPDGRAAILLRRKDEWPRYPVSIGEGLWIDRDGWLTAADGGEFFMCQARIWNSLVHVSLPLDTKITSIARAGSGTDFWLGIFRGVLHLQPHPVLPRTLLIGPKRLVEASRSLRRWPRAWVLRAREGSPSAGRQSPGTTCALNLTPPDQRFSLRRPSTARKSRLHWGRRTDAKTRFGISATARFSGSFRLMKPGNGRSHICHIAILEMPCPCKRC